jgi:hypothetical protein
MKRCQLQKRNTVGIELCIPVGPHKSFLRCIKYGAYRHLVSAGIKYGLPPFRDGKITSSVVVLWFSLRICIHHPSMALTYRTLNGLGVVELE